MERPKRPFGLRYSNYFWKHSSVLGKCTKWSPGTECGLSTSGTDLCFQLRGWRAASTNDDALILTAPQLSNEGDGDIGSDSDEVRILSDEEREQRIAAGKYLYELTTKISLNLEQEAEMVTDIEGTALWILPVVIVVGVFIVSIVLAAMIFVLAKLYRGFEVL